MARRLLGATGLKTERYYIGSILIYLRGIYIIKVPAIGPRHRDQTTSRSTGVQYIYDIILSAVLTEIIYEPIQYDNISITPFVFRQKSCEAENLRCHAASNRTVRIARTIYLCRAFSTECIRA